VEDVRRLNALDDVLPVYRFRERHARTIAATPDVVWGALLSITPEDLPLSRLLMGIRGLPAYLSAQRGGFGVSSRPVIDLFIAGGFRKLRDDPPHALVAGAAIQPWRLIQGQAADVRDLAGFRAFDQPGFVRAVVSFELEPVDRGTRLSTETRVQPTDAGAARAFLPYWLVIRAGSGLIRRDILRAVARRCMA
jgi:hypothetical protein